MSNPWETATTRTPANDSRSYRFNASASRRLPAFGEIVLRICSEEIYQQDIPQLINEFRRRTLRHEALVADMETALAANADFFHGIQKRYGVQADNSSASI